MNPIPVQRAVAVRGPLLRRSALALAVMVALSPLAVAQSPDEEAAQLDSVVVLGSRAKGHTEGETMAPVDVIQSEELRRAGVQEVGQILQAVGQAAVIGARFDPGHPERAGGRAVRKPDRGPAVEADVGRSVHGGVVTETRIDTRVLDPHQFARAHHLSHASAVAPVGAHPAAPQRVAADEGDLGADISEKRPGKTGRPVEHRNGMFHVLRSARRALRPVHPASPLRRSTSSVEPHCRAG